MSFLKALGFKKKKSKSAPPDQHAAEQRALAEMQQAVQYGTRPAQNGLKNASANDKKQHKSSSKEPKPPSRDQKPPLKDQKPPPKDYKSYQKSQPTAPQCDNRQKIQVSSSKDDRLYQKSPMASAQSQNIPAKYDKQPHIKTKSQSLPRHTGRAQSGQSPPTIPGEEDWTPEDGRRIRNLSISRSGRHKELRKMRLSVSNNDYDLFRAPQGSTPTHV